MPEKAYQNVLCIRADNMGDVIMSSPAIRALKESFGSRITLLTSPAGAIVTPFLSCIDEVLSFAPLKENELGGIVARFARESSRRLEAERGIAFRVEESVVAEVLAAEPDRSLGARPLRRAFERLVEGPIAARIVAGDLRPGTRLVVGATRKGEITITPAR